MADTSNFIQTMTKQYNISANTPWIIFGGSYAGALSVWLAEVYPHMVFGVVSSSGPIDPTVNFQGRFDKPFLLQNQKKVDEASINNAFCRLFASG